MPFLLKKQIATSNKQILPSHGGKRPLMAPGGHSMAENDTSWGAFNPATAGRILKRLWNCPPTERGHAACAGGRLSSVQILNI